MRNHGRARRSALISTLSTRAGERLLDLLGMPKVYSPTLERAEWNATVAHERRPSAPVGDRRMIPSGFRLRQIPLS